MNPPKVDTPSLHRVPLRALARLLAVLMVPLVVIATPGVGNAATQYSGTQPVTIRHDSWVPGEWADCTFTAFYAVEGDAGSGYLETVRTKNGDCATGPNFNLEGAAFTLQYNGMTAGGVECAGSTTFALGTDEVMPNSSASMTPFRMDAASLCEVQELCWSFSKTQDWANDLAGSGCEALTMGAPELPTDTPQGSCPDGNPSSAWFSETVSGSQTVYEQLNVTMKDVVANRGWYVMFVDVSSGTVGGYTYGTPQNVTTSVAAASQVWYKDRGKVGSPNQVGIQVVRHTPRPAYSPNQDPFPSMFTATPEGGGKLGTTDPAGCYFYMGPKITTLVDSTKDEPWLPVDGTTAPPPSSEPEPVNTAPTSKPESCNFTLSDPATWLDGGMCAAVGLLGALLGVLRDVLNGVLAIPGAILDGLQGLFVPPDGYMDARTTATRDKINDTTPAKYLDAFDGLASGQVSGCEGIPFNFSMRGETYVQEHIGAACSGSMAQVASLVRIAISAMVVIGGGLACIRALGSGFGWNPNVGTPGGAA